MDNIMDKEIIRKTFDTILTKHSDFLYNIEGTLREITDSKEEYKTLKEDIWRFYKETKVIDHEEMIIKGTDGTFFENRQGKAHSVSLPQEEMDTYLEGGGKFLYSIHNHPYPDNRKSSCFQSLSDLRIMDKYGVKYSVTVGKDGIMITKNPNYNSANLNTFKVLSRYKSVHSEIDYQFDEEYHNKINSLKEKYLTDSNNDMSKLDKFNEEIHTMFQEYCFNNVDKFIDKLNTKFHSEEQDALGQTIEGVDFSCYYIPRSPRLY